jgi:hypothetical protein
VSTPKYESDYIRKVLEQKAADIKLPVLRKIVADWKRKDQRRA